MKGKKIVLGVTGGIAAFKAAALASKLYQAGAELRIIMTPEAKEFITPLTFQALTRSRVYDDTFAEADPSVVSHIDVADWADVFIVAPASANTLGKLANGLADDMLTTTMMATLANVYVAPAMNVNMYNHPSFQRNKETLKQDGYRFIEPGEGYLACGWIGKGRMAEPEDIMQFVQDAEDVGTPLAGKRVLVTAGPTHEHIDPFRVVTNPSSGKMGFAIAEEAARRGAEVTLVAGPVTLSTPGGVQTRIDVESVEDMREAVLTHYDTSDVVIKAAAVSDYRPETVYEKKQKKKNDGLEVPMVKTPDILQELGEKKKHQLLIGFAAESEYLEKYAESKRQRKNADLIVANEIGKAGSGFRADENTITFVDKNGAVSFPTQSKHEAAAEIMSWLQKRIGDA
ncbi:bifunctional phosphopantothenoylcysteine decarboxylase/phosphopantothenate--cysteine ligase CoaBC [Marinococcus luteus]|uniref:bifunctional phosphopantothenoylcysteine decarboxylase/phosphopantothenate--cysteine ligase CoaBC n=1 Tax=Marinococcus luteus TaxID=1122204 RepID=UPI002ACC643B|nr:bifunctional phosphopantothenoylcysteine decarboxylase/phosphopantothenate--cysteine ligase CoaBC [Marinococcus luteus]MDZ5781759.1 bifunctional phosphopantothenoylcysteine decarboxylase/phosphopantothenate--cysteine ligase CoaBC [Marinococcus luteus]